MQRRTIFVLMGLGLVICMCAGLSASGLGVAAFVLAPADEPLAVAAALPTAPSASITTRPRQPGQSAPSSTPAPWQPDPGYTAYADALRALSVHDLAAQLVGAEALWKSVAAVEEALARGGVATTDLTTTYVPAHDPPAGFVAIPAETLQLALEARQPAAVALTVGQYAQMLADFGWPFTADSTPGQQFVALLRDVVNEARQDPESEQSYLGLFLDESAKLKQPPVDLSVQGLAPEQVSLNLLEMQLVAAEFDRGVVLAAAPERQWPPLHLASFAPLTGEREAYAFALQSNPCSALREKWLGQLGGEVSQVGVRELRRAFINHFIGAEHGPETAKTIRDHLAALSMALRIQKLIALYRDSQVAVIPSNFTIHKPNETTPPKYVLFTARAGVNEQEWEEYQKLLGSRGVKAVAAAQDCLKAVGAPTYTDLGALAADASNWQVQWEIRPPDSPHVELKLGGTNPADDENVFDLPGLMQSKLVRTSPTSAETDLRLSIKEERKQDHDIGVENSAFVKVCALVKSASRPQLNTFTTGARLYVGTAQSLVDLGAGWIQTMAPPSSCVPLEITYHDHHSFVLELESRINFTPVGKIEIDKSVVKATIPLQFDRNRNAWVGEGPVQYVSFTVVDTGAVSPCRISAGAPADPAPFEVLEMLIPAELTDRSNPGIQMRYQLNDMRETVITTCPGLKPIEARVQVWRGRFDALHGGSGYTINDWTFPDSGDSSNYAEKRFSRAGFQMRDGTVDEETVFTLRKVR